MSLVSSSVIRLRYEPCGSVEMTSFWYRCARAFDSRLTELEYESCATVSNHLIDKFVQSTTELNYKIVANDFASSYWVRRRNSANTRPNLKTDSRLTGIQK